MCILIKKIVQRLVNKCTHARFNACSAKPKQVLAPSTGLRIFLKPHIFFNNKHETTEVEMSRFKWTCAIVADCIWKKAFKIPSLQFSFA